MSALGLSPSSPAAHLSEEDIYGIPTSPSGATTRTVGIIKNHALDHRFDIEHRISEAGFEVRFHSLSLFCLRFPLISALPLSFLPPSDAAHDTETRTFFLNIQIVKERQMEFDVETDPETLYELFGADYESFAE